MGAKYYNEAVATYTQALDLKLDDPKGNSILLSNRAAVHLLLCRCLSLALDIDLKLDRYADIDRLDDQS